MLDAGDGAALRTTEVASKAETQPKRLGAKRWYIRALMIVAYVIICFLVARYCDNKYLGVFKRYTFFIDVGMIFIAVDQMILVPRANTIRDIVVFGLVVCYLVGSACSCIPNYTPDEAMQVIKEYARSTGKPLKSMGYTGAKRKYVIAGLTEAEPDELIMYVFDPWRGDYAKVIRDADVEPKDHTNTALNESAPDPSQS